MSLSAANFATRPTLPTVIPAKAGIHFARALKSKWIPAFAGMTA
jgi:hypothetical protein